MGDFCIQLLYRDLIGCDTDLSPYNIGLVFNKKGELSHLAPIHDFEYCDGSPYSIHLYMAKCINYFKCFRKYCPERLDDFMENLRKVCFFKNGDFNPTRLNKVINDSKDTTMTDGSISFYFKNFKKNIDRLMFAYDMYKENPETEFDPEDIAFKYNYERFMSK